MPVGRSYTLENSHWPLQLLLPEPFAATFVNPFKPSTLTQFPDPWPELCDSWPSHSLFPLGPKAQVFPPRAQVFPPRAFPAHPAFPLAPSAIWLCVGQECPCIPAHFLVPRWGTSNLECYGAVTCLKFPGGQRVCRLLWSKGKAPDLVGEPT